MNHTYRIFTAEEDELIMRQARGEITLKSLRDQLKTGSNALERRAEELGVTLRRNARISPMHLPPMMQHDTLTPAKIHDDLYLKKLVDVFGHKYLTATMEQDDVEPWHTAEKN
jgi:hypothetical protein